MNETREEFNCYDKFPTGVCIFRFKEKIDILYANEKMLSLAGCSNMEQLRTYCRDDFLNIICDDDRDEIRGLVKVAMANNLRKSHHLQYRIETRAGELKAVDDIGDVQIHPVYGEIVISVLTEITDDNFNIYETKDSVTKLFRRHIFYHYAEDVLHQIQSPDEFKKYSFVFINIRNFKTYNLQFGTNAGNQVLMDVSDLITSCSSTQIVSRFSGDHFVALSNDAEHLLERIERIIAKFNEKYADNALQLKAGIYPVSGSDIRASAACDLAKATCDSIRNSSINIRMYDEHLSKRMQLASYIVSSVDEAIRHKDIKIYYQPVIRTISGALCGMEALARWIDPVHVFLSPADFISVLEENRLIAKLDLYVLREICREMKERERRGYKIVPVSINLSRLDFLECDIFEEVDNIVLAYGVARDMVCIEVTESMVMDDPQIFKTEIKRFRDAGYEVWMDDFGSGYSSLNVLKEYEFDEIKLDMAFLRTFDEKTKGLIKSIISMAKTLGIKTLAEGVETEEQFTFLKEIGCGKAQGYFFSKPVTVQEIIDKFYNTGKQIETRAWHGYYDKINEVDFITDQPLGIVEYDGREFRFLHVNQAYKKVWESVGSTDLDLIYENMQRHGIFYSGTIYPSECKRPL